LVDSEVPEQEVTPGDKTNSKNKYLMAPSLLIDSENARSPDVMDSNSLSVECPMDLVPPVFGTPPEDSAASNPSRSSPFVAPTRAPSLSTLFLGIVPGVVIAIPVPQVRTLSHSELSAEKVRWSRIPNKEIRKRTKMDL
jgi:hypothetical protein